MLRWLAALALVLGSVTLLHAVDEVDYVKVEVKGTLQTGVIAIGGETTGTVIKSGKLTLELDLGGKADFLEFAKKHDGKPVVVQGLYTEKPGVEIKLRKIVVVSKLSPG